MTLNGEEMLSITKKQFNNCYYCFFYYAEMKGSDGNMARGRIYNNFYTPELWEQVNKENKLIIDDFIAEYKQTKKSKNTIYS